MADQTKANTAEVIEATSEVVAGIKHKSGFIRYYDADGNIEKVVEFRADPEQPYHHWA